MQTIIIDEHSDISFTDYAITEIIHMDDEYIIYLNGVVLDGKTHFFSTDSCKLTIGNYISLKINSYNHILERWDECDEDQKLKDICEFTYDGTILSISGFGEREGKWMEYKFTDPQQLRLEIP